MTEKRLIKIFEQIASGDRLNIYDYNFLKQDLLESQNCLRPFDLKDLKSLEPEEIKEIIEQRSQLLHLACSEISQSLITLNIQIDSSSLFPLLWYCWLPLAQSLAQQQQKIGRTFIQGLLGAQGTGKTTLGIVLNILLRRLGKTFLSISLDDLYKTYTERQKLRDRCPALIWRGPPSTHDIDLGIQVLQQLRDRPLGKPQEIAIPRFDKSLHNGAGDRSEPEISYNADIVLFEGWFVGMRPVPISKFQNFIPPILSESDRDFALECNANLDNYLPLWEYLDSLIVLIPKDYNYSIQWRLEAEHKLIATGKSGLSDQEISQFVEYFWKALHPKLFLPHMIGDQASDRVYVDLVIEISRSHLPTHIYRP